MFNFESRGASPIRARTLPLPILASFVAALVACSGGDRAIPGVTLRAALTAHGTILRCESANPTTVRLERRNSSGESAELMLCPGGKAFKGDYRLSLWRATATGISNGLVTSTTTTALPAPVLLRDGERMVFVSEIPNVVLREMGLILEGRTSYGSPKTSISGLVSGSTLSADQIQELSWRLVASDDVGTYRSRPARVLGFTERNLGYWGPATVHEVDGLGQARLVGEQTLVADPDALVAAGLGPLLDGRIFRDVAVVDLNGDGRPDLVSNVYGSGCVMLAYGEPDNTFSFDTPLRTNGECFGGHGETILVADFDQDGRTDVFLPTYERFDLLRNLGDARFEEIGESRGISFPNYTPLVEGGAAVDIDMNGTIDIVIASEVLLNDGQGNFTRMLEPFGLGGVGDEGMSVADLDGDGILDIIKNNPTLGPRIFWGQSDHVTFKDDGWLFGGAPVLSRSFGLTVADFTGKGLMDFVIAGGDPAGSPPVLCVQFERRQFECLFNFFQPDAGQWQDLLLSSDIDGDGRPDLIARFGGMRIYTNNLGQTNAYRFDLRSGSGAQNQFGRVVQARCELGGDLLGTAIVDGGNGYMSHGAYRVTFSSDWCEAVVLKVFLPGGPLSFGPFSPGEYQVVLPTL